jgi:hypothetical protein
MRGAAGAVADDDDVGIERFQVSRGVLERLALFERRGFGGKIDDIGRQTLGGQLETDARASGRLDKQIDHRFAAQNRDFFNGALPDRLESEGGVQHG